MLGIERRIPRNLGGTDTLLDDAPLVGTVEFSDGIVAFGPAILSLMVVNNVLPSEYGWVGMLTMGVLGFAGFLLLLAKPNYLSLSEWIRNYREFKKRPKHIQKQIATDGGYDENGVPMSSSPDTRKHTQLQKIHPAANAVERTDGVMVGMVKLGGLNLDTAQDRAWMESANSLANWFNTQSEYDVQFYLPMRQFDPTDYMNMYLDRLEDPDVQSNPLLHEYMEDRAAWMQGIASQSFIREFYVVVTVEQREVLSDQLNQGDAARNLSKAPGGQFLQDFMDGLRGQDTATVLSDSEIKDRQLRELQRRLNEVRSGLGEGGSNNAQIVGGDKLGVLLKEYWEGVTIHEGEADNFVRRKPFVTAGDSR